MSHPPINNQPPLTFCQIAAINDCLSCTIFDQSKLLCRQLHRLRYMRFHGPQTTTMTSRRKTTPNLLSGTMDAASSTCSAVVSLGFTGEPASILCFFRFRFFFLVCLVGSMTEGVVVVACASFVLPVLLATRGPSLSGMDSWWVSSSLSLTTALLLSGTERFRFLFLFFLPIMATTTRRHTSTVDVTLSFGQKSSKHARAVDNWFFASRLDFGKNHTNKIVSLGQEASTPSDEWLVHHGRMNGLWHTTKRKISWRWVCGENLRVCLSHHLYLCPLCKSCQPITNEKPNVCVCGKPNQTTTKRRSKQNNNNRRTKESS